MQVRGAARFESWIDRMRYPPRYQPCLDVSASMRPTGNWSWLERYSGVSSTSSNCAWSLRISTLPCWCRPWIENICGSWLWSSSHVPSKDAIGDLLVCEAILQTVSCCAPRMCRHNHYSSAFFLLRLPSKYLTVWKCLPILFKIASLDQHITNTRGTQIWAPLIPTEPPKIRSIRKFIKIFNCLEMSSNLVPNCSTRPTHNQNKGDPNLGPLDPNGGPRKSGRPVSSSKYLTVWECLPILFQIAALDQHITNTRGTQIWAPPDPNGAPKNQVDP